MNDRSYPTNLFPDAFAGKPAEWTVLEGFKDAFGHTLALLPRFELAFFETHELRDDLEDELAARGLELHPEHGSAEPAVCDDSRPPGISDVHAWLRYLNDGGTLCIVPDSDDPTSEEAPYYRVVAVQRLAAEARSA